MAVRRFPALTPTGRKYTPGRLPETRFQSQNGATTFVQFGGYFVNAKLELTFENVRDEDARAILVHYRSTVADDYVTFDKDHGLGGMTDNLITQVDTGSSTLRYRYDGPPEVVSVFPGVSSVSCSFIGYLYGA